MATSKLKEVGTGAEDQDKKRSNLLKRYLKRFDHVKQGQDHYARDEYPAAIEAYRNYLLVMIDWYDVDIKTFSPELFDLNRDHAELLVISHIFWDLARIYDRVPTLTREFEGCLDQFVNFSIGMKYQALNLRVLGKFLRTYRPKNKGAFERAHTKLLTRSKKCFVATYCFGEDHPITERFRGQREHLVKSRLGKAFVTRYYLHSPAIVEWLENHPQIGYPLRELLFIPCLRLLSKILK